MRHTKWTSWVSYLSTHILYICVFLCTNTMQKLVSYHILCHSWSGRYICTSKLSENEICRFWIYASDSFSFPSLPCLITGLLIFKLFILRIISCKFSVWHLDQQLDLQLFAFWKRGSVIKGKRCWNHIYQVPGWSTIYFPGNNCKWVGSHDHGHWILLHADCRWGHSQCPHQAECWFSLSPALDFSLYTKFFLQQM